MKTNYVSRVLNRSASGDGTSQPFSIVAQVTFASVVMFVLVFGFGGWAALANLSGAVIAPGSFVVERNVKKVQHSYGGIVSEINVRNGDKVTSGQVLLKLDPTQIKAELGVIRSQITDLTARAARLAAERDDLPEMILPEAFLAEGPEAQAAATGEARLFTVNRKTRQSQKEQLALRIEQLREEIIGLSAQRDAKLGELAIIKKELAQIRSLHDQRLTSITRVYAMEREETRLNGEHGGLVAQIARATGQISEINVQILTIEESARAEAQRELRTVDSRRSELAEREIAAKDRLNRIDIRAPQSGVVHELAVHTIGGVITAAEAILLIVPEEEDLLVEARFSPTEIDQVMVGRPATLRLSAFNQQQTPELDAIVTNVSADVMTDPKTGFSHYVARLAMTEKARRSIGDLKLVPGMPVEVFMSTGERTALSYLVKPFSDQMERAFRE